MRTISPTFFTRELLAVALFACCLSLCAEDAAKGGAMKLPDGTVVFFTQNPSEASPKIDGVILSPKEYQQLLEQAEQAKKARDGVKPASPSVTRIQGKIDTKNGKPLAKLTIEYSCRTTQPRTSILLAGQRAAPTAARDSDGKLPLLELVNDGLVAVIEKPGEHKLTVEYETNLTSRGTKNETGFEIGLPRSAITTLSFEMPPSNPKLLNLGTRTAESASGRPNELTRISEEASRLVPQPGFAGIPLGPIEWLELSWQTPTVETAKPIEATLRTETDVTTQVEETQIETTTKIKLRGPAREWLVSLPKEAVVSASALPTDRPALLAALPTITPPKDAKQPWAIQTPDATEWLVTSVVRQPRPNTKDAKYTGPYSVPIGWVQGVPRQSGTVRLTASPSIQLWNFRASPELLRQEIANGAEANIPTFRFTSAGTKPPTLDFDARPVRGTIAIQPKYQFFLTPRGWQLKAEVNVTPSRSTVEQLNLMLPTGWGDPTVGPDKLVDEVVPGKANDGKLTYTIRLSATKSEPFTLTLETTHPLPESLSELAVAIPRVTSGTERESQYLVTVPNDWTVTSSAREGGPNANIQPLLPAAGVKPGSAVTQLAGTFDTPISQLQLTWQPYRPKLNATIRAELTLGERQLNVVETIQFQANDPLTRSIRLTGPISPIAFQTNPPVEPNGNGLWELTPPRDAKEFTFQVSYTVPLPPRAVNNSSAALEVPLVWPDASKMSANVRVWGTLSGAIRRPILSRGGWEERAAEPSNDRDSLPWLTLRTTSTGKGVPLSLELVERTDSSSTMIERAAIQHQIANDGSVHARARYLLKRWVPMGVDIELACAGTPTVTVNRERVENLILLSNENEKTRVYRVPFPELKTNRPLTLEVQYHGPPQPGSTVELPPPRLRNSVLLSPAWWHVSVPAQRTALVWGRGTGQDYRWGFRQGLPTSLPAVTSQELDVWFQAGQVADADIWSQNGEHAVTTRQTNLVPLQIVLLPRATILWFASLAGGLLGMLLAHYRSLRSWLYGLGIVGLIACVVGWLLAPQPVTQIISLGIPGLLLAGLLLWGSVNVRRWVQSRADRDATFRRTSEEGSVPLLKATTENANGTAPKINSGAVSAKPMSASNSASVTG